MFKDEVRRVKESRFDQSVNSVQLSARVYRGEPEDEN